MPVHLPPLRMTGARLLRDGVLQPRTLAIAGGKVSKGPYPEVDMTGFTILPGMVNLFGETVTGRTTSAAALTRAAAASGITTCWLSQDFSWAGGGGAAETATRAVARLRAETGRLPVDVRPVIVCETHLVGEADRLIDLLRSHGVDQVQFRNRLGWMIEMSSVEPERFRSFAAAAGRTPEEHLCALRSAKALSREVPRHLCRLAEAFDGLGVIYGSLGDPDAETREHFSMIGARLAMFPESRRVAASANAMGDPVVLCAGDVAADRIGTHEMIREGRCAAMASGRDFGALLAAVWRLVDRGVLDLASAWRLVSCGPAAVMRLPDRGRLDHGRRADFVAISDRTRKVELTVSQGRIAHLGGEAARRFEGVFPKGRMAAE